ncbi:hypothetical protein ED208_12715 [Stagnimonas aquatica]|uniref:Baseplate structural protein Gp10 C-terminal domain-containing protein n=1 Tax=Stagnimonas aquatica TaxID=2689987 RepID=A0A3N0V7L0_9GAMM|nr:hypothetical protein [Stagnimonas aquatica]ROH88675.1 hypothetical protein ED208_12715 [Stagnimonas aquatica]
MRRISAPYTAPGNRFQDAVPGTSQKATFFVANWFNDVQESLLFPIEASGRTPSADPNQLFCAMVDLIYPVGSYRLSEAEDSPAVVYTWQTWVEVAGRVLVGLDAAQTEFNVVGKQGGAKTHTLTVDEMPNHGHPTGGQTGLAGTGDDLSLPGQGTPQEVGAVGGGQPHNNLQPYRVVRMWRRTD